VVFEVAVCCLSHVKK